MTLERVRVGLPPFAIEVPSEITNTVSLQREQIDQMKQRMKDQMKQSLQGSIQEKFTDELKST